MQAAAFRPRQGAVHNQPRHRRDIAQLQQVARHDEVPIILLDLLLQVGDALLRALQPLVGPHDAHVIPHQPPDFVPVVRDDDQFIGVGRLSGLPRRNLYLQLRQRLGDHLDCRAVRADQRFEQRVARQPVRPVQTRAGDLADRIKTGDFSFAIDVREHAAALIMRCRHNGDRLPGDVHAVAQAGLINVRKPFADELRRLVRDVKQHVVGAALFHFTVDGARHDIAQRERFERVISVHELDAVDALKHAALAAHCFADEE